MRTILILITLFISSTIIGQNNPNIPEKYQKYLYDHKVTLTKINFHINDTIIPYTLIQEPNGSLYFKEGYQFTNDSVSIDYQFFYRSSKKQKDTLIPNLVFIKNNTVLELYDLFSHFSLKNGGILYTYDFDFHFIQYIHELNYSYIFHNIGLPPLTEIDVDSIVRLTNYEFSPSYETPRVTIYELIPTSTLKQIKKISYSIDSTQNFILSKEEIIPLIKSEIKLLNTTFQTCLKEKIKYSIKTKQSNHFLIELKLGDYFDTFERSDNNNDGGDVLDRKIHYYHSEFQSFVGLVSTYGNLPQSKIEKRKQKLIK